VTANAAPAEAATAVPVQPKKRRRDTPEEVDADESVCPTEPFKGMSSLGGDDCHPAGRRPILMLASLDLDNPDFIANSYIAGRLGPLAHLTQTFELPMSVLRPLGRGGTNRS
jgi:hypothetical protein